ncbi:uncharacterized G-patch domain protein DDB_G0278987-like [Clytia hemisphaerica]|uniref:Uncharacterized protein n=1 Tax=Clytia hemisphaerica TaxID=252671 RepID=A0A7M5XAZ1_9CNID
MSTVNVNSSDTTKNEAVRLSLSHEFLFKQEVCQHVDAHPCETSSASLRNVKTQAFSDGSTNVKNVNLSISDKVAKDTSTVLVDYDKIQSTTESGSLNDIIPKDSPVVSIDKGTAQSKMTCKQGLAKDSSNLLVNHDTLQSSHLSASLKDIAKDTSILPVNEDGDASLQKEGQQSETVEALNTKSKLMNNTMSGVKDVETFAEVRLNIDLSTDNKSMKTKPTEGLTQQKSSSALAKSDDAQSSADASATRTPLGKFPKFKDILGGWKQSELRQNKRSRNSKANRAKNTSDALQNELDKTLEANKKLRADKSKLQEQLFKEKAKNTIATKWNVVLTFIRNRNTKKSREEEDIDRHIDHLERELKRKTSLLERMGVDRDEDTEVEVVENGILCERDGDWWNVMESEDEGEWWGMRRNKVPMVERTVRGWERDQDEDTIQVQEIKNELSVLKDRFQKLSQEYKIVSNTLSELCGVQHDLEDQYKEVSEELDGTADKRRKKERKKARGSFGQKFKQLFGCASSRNEPPKRLEDITDANECLAYLNSH